MISVSWPSQNGHSGSRGMLSGISWSRAPEPDAERSAPVLGSVLRNGGSIDTIRPTAPDYDRHEHARSNPGRDSPTHGPLESSQSADVSAASISTPPAASVSLTAAFEIGNEVHRRGRDPGLRQDLPLRCPRYRAKPKRPADAPQWPFVEAPLLSSEASASRPYQALAETDVEFLLREHLRHAVRCGFERARREIPEGPQTRPRLQ